MNPLIFSELAIQEARKDIFLYIFTTHKIKINVKKNLLFEGRSSFIRPLYRIGRKTASETKGNTRRARGRNYQPETVDRHRTDRHRRRFQGLETKTRIRMISEQEFKSLQKGDRVLLRYGSEGTVQQDFHEKTQSVKVKADVKRWSCPYFFRYEIKKVLSKTKSNE